MENHHKVKLLYAVGAGLLLSDLIPTPADGVYFNYQKNNKQKLEKEEITPKQYWIRDAVGYYGFNAIWWTSVLGASYLLGKDFIQKRNLMIGLIAGGVVFSVLNKNIKSDIQFYKSQKEIK
jgi:uncharacterized membrane protein YkvI